jgi:hypothetical protein
LLKVSFFIAIFALFSSGCTKDLLVEKFEICDLFDNNGICKEPWKEKKIYLISIPSEKNLKTWEDLSHHLYFKARETPGVLIHWNRDLNEDERKSMQGKDCIGVYQFLNTSGIMEGKEIGSNWVGFFQYLGTILEEERKTSKKWTHKIQLDEIFPAKLSLGFKCNNIQHLEPLIVDIKILRKDP